MYVCMYVCMYVHKSTSYFAILDVHITLYVCQCVRFYLENESIVTVYPLIVACEGISDDSRMKIVMYRHT